MPDIPHQLSFFDGAHGNLHELSKALDTVNDRYGDMVIGSALLADMDNFLLDRIAFVGVKDAEDLYDK